MRRILVGDVRFFGFSARALSEVAATATPAATFATPFNKVRRDIFPRSIRTIALFHL